MEVPAKLDLAPQPFQRQPFQGVRTQREMAERMRAQPKAGVPLLESGEVGRWFEANGWKYPVRGTPAKGVAGGAAVLRKPGAFQAAARQAVANGCLSQLQVSPGATAQVTLKTPAKKWVYANVESDAPWLKVLTPAVSGPQQVQIGYAIDVRQAPPEGMAEGHLTVYSNGGQKLSLRVILEVEGLKPSLSRRFLQPAITCMVAFFLLRLALVPILDVYGRGLAADEALARVAADVPANERPALAWGGWLKLSWTRIYLDPRPDVLDDQLQICEAKPGSRTRDFRDYFTSRVLRVVVGFTWWIGAIVGVLVLWRRGNVLDAPWGLLAGAAAGIVVSATLGSIVLAGDLGPHLAWDLLPKNNGDGLLLLPLWVLLAVAWWTALGIVVGIVLTVVGPFGRLCLVPLQIFVAGCFRLIGLRRLGEYFAPLA